MNVLLVLALLGSSGPGGAFDARVDAYEDALAAAREERFGEAWGHLELVDDPLRQARGQAEVFHVAGDLGRAMAAAERGLTYEPRNLELLFRTSSIALTLADADRAAAYVSRLGAALETSELTASDREAWERSLSVFERRTAELEVLTNRSQGSVERARLAAVTTLVLVLSALVFLVRLPSGARG